MIKADIFSSPLSFTPLKKDKEGNRFADTVNVDIDVENCLSSKEQTNIIMKDNNNDVIFSDIDGICLFPNNEVAEKSQTNEILGETNKFLLIVKCNVEKQIDQRKYFSKQCSAVIHNFLKYSNLSECDDHFERFDLVDLFKNLCKNLYYFYVVVLVSSYN